MGQHERGQEPQPGRGVPAAGLRITQAVERRRQAVADAFEPEQMQEKENDEADRDDPRFDGLERGPSAFGDRGENCEQA